MCVFHLNFSRLDVKLCAQELGTEKCKLNAKCLTAHLTNCAWERLSPLSALSSDEHQFRVPAGPKPLEEQKGHMDCFFSSKLGLPDSNPGGCTDDWRMPGPDILNRLARKSLKSFIRQFQGLPLGIQGLAVRFAHEGVFAWARAAETAWAGAAWAPVAAAWADVAWAHAAWADAAWGADAARAPVAKVDTNSACGRRRWQ